jgi:hypothetical protein
MGTEVYATLVLLIRQVFSCVPARNFRREPTGKISTNGLTASINNVRIFDPSRAPFLAAFL